MAAELEKLAQDLKIAGYGDGAIILSSVARSLRRTNLIPARLYRAELAKSTPEEEGAKILTSELAFLINKKCSSELTDDVPLVLLVGWDSGDESVPRNWRDVLLNCSREERKMIRKVLSGLWGFGNRYLTLGEVRQAIREDLPNARNIGPISRQFIRYAFTKKGTVTEFE